MNVLLGSYGKGGAVSMEVDYIRYYQWPLVNGNELPNPGFELGNSLEPWEGTAIRSNKSKRSGNYGAVLEAGQSLQQYVYVNNNKKYQLKYWIKGNGILSIKVEDIKQVSGTAENEYSSKAKCSSSFVRHTLNFTSGREYGKNMKTIKITFSNDGKQSITLDDLQLIKDGYGGNYH